MIEADEGASLSFSCSVEAVVHIWFSWRDNSQGGQHFWRHGGMIPAHGVWEVISGVFSEHRRGRHIGNPYTLSRKKKNDYSLA